MREVVFSAKFDRDLKRLHRSASEKVLLDLNDAVKSLADDISLRERMKDHRLAGGLNDFRECHIRPDLLLIYRKTPGKLYLARIGGHSELFR